jgi:L-aspartate oxidase
LATDRTDFLIIGSGIAGLRAAIGLAGAGHALILTKAEPRESNTGYAQGGIAAAIGADDSPALHAADTIRAGDGLCDEAAVGVLVEEGITFVRELLEWGTRFDCDADGRPALGREAAHSVRRVLHAGDATGREIGRVLHERVSTLPSVSTVNHSLVTELLVEDGAACGARYFDQAGRPREVRARSTLLATGGAGQVFRETTNPPVATGDGVALAFHAGARLADLEFVQFHPTALNRADAPRFLISEALRGEGARLVDQRLEPFAHLDADYVRRRFPTIAEMCGRLGLDLACDPIPVGPAAHYIMGGVDTDEWGRTSMAGLFAAGEVACTGVHGANRLASNSLLEGLVFGARAAIAMREPPAEGRMKPDRRVAGDLLPAPSHQPPASSLQTSSPSLQPPASSLPDATVLDTPAIRDLMWRSAGLFRTRNGLEDAFTRLDRAYAAERIRVRSNPSDGDSWRHFNLLTVARLIVRAALRREESRGGHFRADFPDRNDRDWRFHAIDLENRVIG